LPGLGYWSYASGKPETAPPGSPQEWRFRGTYVPARHDPLGRLPCRSMPPEDDDKDETITVAQQHEQAKQKREQDAVQKELLQEAERRRREREQREQGDS